MTSHTRPQERTVNQSAWMRNGNEEEEKKKEKKRKERKGGSANDGGQFGKNSVLTQELRSLQSVNSEIGILCPCLRPPADDRQHFFLQNGRVFFFVDALWKKNNVEKYQTHLNILLIVWPSEMQSAFISLVSSTVSVMWKARIRDLTWSLSLSLSHLRQRTAMTTVATMTTKPAKAEPTMRGSWSCTERSGSSARERDEEMETQLRHRLRMQNCQSFEKC